MPPTQVMTDDVVAVGVGSREWLIVMLHGAEIASHCDVARRIAYCDVARSRNRFGAGSVGIAVIVASFSCAASHVGGGELD